MSGGFNLISNIVYNFYTHYLIDFATNQPQLSTGEIESVISDINYVLNITNIIVISIYTNSEGTAFAIDSKGNAISNRNVIIISHVSPYVNTTNGITNNINGYISFLFDDNATFRVYDTDQRFFYYINGVVPNDIKILT